MWPWKSKGKTFYVYLRARMTISAEVSYITQVKKRLPVVKKASSSDKSDFPGRAFAISKSYNSSTCFLLVLNVLKASTNVVKSLPGEGVKICLRFGERTTRREL